MTFAAAAGGIVVSAEAQIFRSIDADIQPVQFGDVGWGDVNGDGRLDVAVTGQESLILSAGVSLNLGGDRFERFAGFQLPELVGGSLAFADIDQDGDDDLFLTGSDRTIRHQARLYRNLGNGVFRDLRPNILGTTGGSVDFADLDGDGDPDMLLTGDEQEGVPLGAVTLILRNDAGVFTETPARLTGVYAGEARFGDYDNDGDADIALVGLNQFNVPVAEIWRNDAGVFVNINATLTGVALSTVAWGDYDNDNDLDLLVTGSDVSPLMSNPRGLTRLYRNDAGSFVDSGVRFEDVSAGRGVFADYNNDGNLDVLITGGAGETGRPVTRLYRGDGAGGFEVAGDSGLRDLSASTAAFADYDGDGDLDLLIAGYNQDIPGGAVYNTYTMVYRNDGPPADMNRDGGVDFNDVLVYLNMFTAGDPRADLNRDGTIDFNDLLVFLNRYNWGW
jgi:hypothetical protein